MELKSNRRNSLKYLLIGVTSFKIYIALLGLTKSVNFVLHKTVVTRRELRLVHLADNDICIYCSNVDSIEHTFIDCRESVKRYSQIKIIMVQSLPRYRSETLE